MATKTEFLTQVNSLLASSSNIEATELRQIFYNTVDELYSDWKYEEISFGIADVNNTILEASSPDTDIDVYFIFKKVGNICYFTGRISNNSNFNIGGYLFNFKTTSPSKPKIQSRIAGLSFQTNQAITFLLDPLFFYVYETIFQNEDIYLQGFYETN